MNGPKLRGSLIVCGISAVLFSGPGVGHACQCLDRLMPWNWGRQDCVATTYAPPYSPVAWQTQSACSTQTCCYVPQTCYRPVYRAVPTTTLQAVTSCDPCSGCPVTCYRPVTSYSRCVQYVPYTTYRAVWSNPCSTSACAVGCSPSASACDPCGSACGVSGLTTSSGCTSCSNGITTTTPSTSAAATAPTYTPQTTTSPAPATAPSTVAPKTFQSTPQQQPSTSLKPIPETKIQNNSTNMPQLIDPDDRSAAKPIQQANYYQTVSQTVVKELDNSGWRNAR